MKVLITGANGQLGSEFRALADDYASADFLFRSSAELNITNEKSVESFFNQNKPDVCINCAAYTAVDKAESEQEKAFLVNATAVGGLAKICATHHVKLIHISTDFVFDGLKPLPLRETDETNPLGVYGASKLEGEKLAFQHAPNSIIVRTSWVYSTFGNNFLKTVLRLCREKPALNIIFDQTGTPTYARDLARAILEIVADENKLNQKGIFHFSNEGVCSWYDFAVAIRNLAGLNTPVSPIETHQYPTPATRPKYSVLNKQKFKNIFGTEIPHWQESLKNCMKQM